MTGQVERAMVPILFNHRANLPIASVVNNQVMAIKTGTRTISGFVWLERLWQDVRYGWRMLGANPGFTLVAVSSLAMGIGANCAAFSWADALLLRPLTVARPGEVVTVGSAMSVEGFSRVGASYREYIDVRDRSTSFDGLVAFTGATSGLAPTRDALPKLKLGLLVSANFFTSMGVEPELGRTFRPEEDQVPGRDAVVILSHSLWEQQFDSDRSILGRHVQLSGIEFTVVGVAPERFTGMNQYVRSDFYAPLMMWPRLLGDPKERPLEDRNFRNITIKGRLKSGVSMARAQTELSVIAKDLERAYPDTNRNRGLVVRTELQTRIAQSPPDSTLIAMLTTLAGSTQTSPTYWLNPKTGVSYPVSIQTPQRDIGTMTGLQNIPVSASAGTGTQLLGGLSTIERMPSNAVVSHYNVRPIIDIYATPQGRDLGGIATEIHKVMQDMAGAQPNGTSTVLRGQVTTMTDAYQQLFIGLAFAIVLIYLLIVVNFQSWLDPFVIVMALPTALAGIVWMLFATGTTLSVPALTGAIMCMGVATANSILVISFARERLAAGADALAAALDAGSTRFRPVLMTALAMIIGMTPMALEAGQNAPLGRAVIGGLLFATFATLFFVPTLFSVVHGRVGKNTNAAATLANPQPAG